MNEPLKVLLLVNDLSIGGAERQLVELAKRLDQRRFHPIVATLSSGQPLERELVGCENVRVVSLERQHRYDFTTLAKLVRLLRRERVHIIQPYLTPATFFGLVASLMARTPVKIATERSGVRPNAGNLFTQPYRFAQYRLLPLADVVVANSESGRDDLVTRGIRPDKIRVIYNGVNPSRIAVDRDESLEARHTLGLPPDARVVGIVARLEAVKDHETFLRAAARVRRALPNTYFLVVGDGSLRPHLEAIARELGLEGHALFVGKNVRVAPFIDCFDVAVLSSSEKEGCSNFLLEAMGMGKPVVCTAVGGNPELVVDGENGCLVRPKDPERLANAIVSLLTDPLRGRDMGEKGRQMFRSRFTLEQMVRAYEDLYAEMWNLRTGDVAAPHGFRTPQEQMESVD